MYQVVLKWRLESRWSRVRGSASASSSATLLQMRHLVRVGVELCGETAMLLGSDLVAVLGD